MNSLSGKLGQRIFPLQRIVSRFHLDQLGGDLSQLWHECLRQPENVTKKVKAYYEKEKIPVGIVEAVKPLAKNFSLVSFANTERLSPRHPGRFVHLISFITAQARSNLTEFIRTAGPYQVYYSDTDSLVTTTIGYEALKSAGCLHDMELGKLKIEERLSFFHALMPKTYFYITAAGKPNFKCKGMNFKSTEISVSQLYHTFITKNSLTIPQLQFKKSLTGVMVDNPNKKIAWKLHCESVDHEGWVHQGMHNDYKPILFFSNRYSV